MDEYLRPTRFLDTENSAVQAFARAAVGDAATEKDRAIRLFYAVRDGIRYNPYAFGTDEASFVASHVLAAGQAFCIPKAILLAAAARAVGIPSRLNFADVKNHLSSPKLLEALRTDVFSFHGSTELYLAGRWVKVTPAFNRTLCEKMKVAPIEFDGVHEAIFQPFDTAGGKFMEYVYDHGSFADLPVAKMVASFHKHYPHLFGGELPTGGDLESEV
jgi:transglutaminase-like putative cysteine protease